LHHLAFHARSRAAVRRAHRLAVALGATILEPPAEYPAYGAGYYALFFLDPDGIKLEIVHDLRAGKSAARGSRPAPRRSVRRRQKSK
jgi:predicted lactoylglutathione lyase